VELCVEQLSSYFTGDTPCSDQPFVRSSTTGANGAFFFDDLPPGFYVLTVETADGWAQLTNDLGLGSERVPVNAGVDTGLGELTVTEQE
ncbi:MAG: carboxypeptidase-like regulatory domain-containing protein, partial [Candidatus Promineifilaceae bacterium]